MLHGWRSSSVFLVLLFASHARAQLCGGAGGVYWSTTLTKCVACPADTFCAGDCVNACNACPPNTIPDATKATCVSGTCSPCPIGYYCAGGLNVVACPAGRYGAREGLVSASDCAACAVGTYAPTVGMSACTLCGVGTYADVALATVCTGCAVGAYQSLLGAASCLACERGTYNGVSTLSSKCGPCLAGTYSELPGSSACVACPGGSYATGAGSLNVTTNCTLCGAGSYSTLEGATALAACVKCAMGYYQPDQGALLCLACPKDTYLNTTGAAAAASCLTCAPFSETVGTNSTTRAQCLCSKGYFSSGSVCAPCVAGSYASALNQTSCIPCPPNTYDTPNTMLLRSTPIICANVPLHSSSPAGASDFMCDAGYRRFLSFTCELCPTHFFSVQGANNCTPCYFGSTDAGVLATSQAACKCNAGYFKATNVSACEPCRAGFYCYGGREAPVACGLGKGTLGVVGAVDASSCVCEAGWYGAVGSLPCTKCSAGYYCEVGASSQLPCPTNAESPLGSQSALNCTCRSGFKFDATQGFCVLCSAGEVCLTGTVSLCRNHSTATGGGATSQADCTCEPGFWSSTAISECQVSYN